MLERNDPDSQINQSYMVKKLVDGTQFIMKMNRIMKIRCIIININQILTRGGGTFNENGLKDGFWLELSDNFCKNRYFIYQGCYKNGIKYGKWEIFFHQLLIGGGKYDQNGMKDQFWIELGINSSKLNKLIYQGKYKNGRKQEIWDIFYDEERIGGGEFDVNGLKDGYWIELSDYFQFQHQITFNGIYKNGHKSGNWNIMLRMYKDRPFQQIGGGFFDSNGKKKGSWIDFGIEFSNLTQITYTGKYKDNKKYGKWEVIYQKKKIGGGSYDSNEIKNGKWIDLCENYNYQREIIYDGEYQHGQKCGRWNISFRLKGDFQIIGGGSFDIGEIKNGKWSELDEKFHQENQIITIGFYKNGKKIGKWTKLQRQAQRLQEGFKIMQSLFLKILSGEFTYSFE